jgi:alpha-L-fucosidase 2
MSISNSRLLALIAMSLATVDGLKLWTQKPANPNVILMSAYVVGNGKQGGLWHLTVNC